MWSNVTQMNEIALTLKPYIEWAITQRGGWVCECVCVITQAAKDKSVCMLVGRLGIWVREWVRGLNQIKQQQPAARGGEMSVCEGDSACVHR